jgi:hypothetical protein
MLLVSSLASAGLVLPSPLSIDMTNMAASGDMRSARNSTNKAAYIGCGIRASAAGAYIFCQAGLTQDASQQVVCFSDSPALVEAVKAIGDFSYITFRWNANGDCTYVGNSTQSIYLPSSKDS